MARAVRYHTGRSARGNTPSAGDAKLENPGAKAKIIANRAARQAARAADPTVKKSTAQRAENRVNAAARRINPATPNATRKLVNSARAAVRKSQG